MIIIDPHGNLTLRVLEPVQKNDHRGDRQDEEVNEDDSSTLSPRIEEFQVRKSTLMAHSPVFKAMLSPGNFAEGGEKIVDLMEDRIVSMEILLRVLHDTSFESTLGTPIKEMWPLVLAADKYNLDIMKFQKWFEKWRESAKLDLSKMPDAATLLYPCYIFSHAPAFARATRALAYGSIGHITEINPTKHYELHLPSRVIQAINAAKGRLRTILHADLFRPNARLLGATCKCKEKTLFDYEKTLYDLDVWPLEQVAQRNSVSVILGRLQKFNYEAPESACLNCHYGYGKNVAEARARVASYFDGLCLDCMDRSKPKTGDTDKDYWQHNDLSEDDIIQGCRFVHKQPTWYFSFMGRKEDRERFTRPRRGN